MYDHVPLIVVVFRRATDDPYAYRLKTGGIYHLPASVGPQSDRRLAVWFWLRIPHEASSEAVAGGVLI